MDRLKRAVPFFCALTLGVGLAAVAQADDKSGGEDGSSRDGGRTTTIKAVTSPATTTTTGTTVSTVPVDETKSGSGNGDDHRGSGKTVRTGDLPAQTAVPAPPAQAVIGESVGVTPDDGSVRVRGADGAWNDLDAGAALPNDTVVDTRRGVITLAPTVDDAGTQQSATFTGAVFAFHQPNATHSVTRLKLTGGDFSVCKRGAARAHGARAVAAARRKPVRQLFGSGHGRFRTEGRFAAATVHGTVWVTKDYCDRTVVTVRRGVVGVTSLRTGRTVSVRAGHSVSVPRP